MSTSTNLFRILTFDIDQKSHIYLVILQINIDLNKFLHQIKLCLLNNHHTITKKRVSQVNCYEYLNFMYENAKYSVIHKSPPIDGCNNHSSRIRIYQSCDLVNYFELYVQSNMTNIITSCFGKYYQMCALFELVSEMQIL